MSRNAEIAALLEEFADHLHEETDESLFLAAAQIAVGTAAFEDEIIAQLL